MSAPITVACTFDSATRRKDRTVRLSFSSNLEISNEDFAAMDRQTLSAGWCLFSPNDLKLEDLPRHDAPTEERKTKAQRLRAVYFLLWRQTYSDQDFEAWYSMQFEALLDRMKARLDQ